MNGFVNCRREFRYAVESVGWQCNDLYVMVSPVVDSLVVGFYFWYAVVTFRFLIWFNEFDENGVSEQESTGALKPRHLEGNESHKLRRHLGFKYNKERVKLGRELQIPSNYSFQSELISSSTFFLKISYGVDINARLKTDFFRKINGTRVKFFYLRIAMSLSYKNFCQSNAARASNENWPYLSISSQHLPHYFVIHSVNQSKIETNEFYSAKTMNHSMYRFVA